jgi:dihydroxyacid dehydratase/phosphogluconate dehydratase
MLRLNIPSVLMYGGSILPGKFKGRDVTVVDVFEAVGQHAAGGMSDAKVHERKCVACPSAGAYGGQFTANTMATVSEAIGLALPGSAGSPAPFEERDRFATDSGRAVMQLIDRIIRPRDMVTLKALQNAAAVIGATGGSTNVGLHLPATAHEAGIRFTMDDVMEIIRRIPYIADRGVVGLKGSLAPDGAIVKVAGLHNLQFDGSALCFDSEEEAYSGVAARAYKDGDVIIIRYEGPKVVLACVKCCLPPTRSTAKVWVRKWR